MAVIFRTAIARDGSRIGYTLERGSGTPLLCIVQTNLPPASVYAHYSGALAFHRGLAAGASWYTFDWRGTGLSLRQSERLKFDDLVDDLEAVAASITEPFDLFGSADGCTVALAFAKRRPECVRRMLLVAPPAPEAGDPQFAAASRRMATMEPEATLALWMMHIFPGVDRAETLAIAKESHSVKPPALVKELQRTVATVDALELAPQVTAATLVLTPGEHDQRGLDVAAAMPNACTMFWTELGDGTMSGANWRRAWDQLVPPSELPQRVVHPSPATRDASPLSEREVSVLALLMQGCSNREIAERLVIAEPTVATHVRHILEKTGTSNRTAAAAWASRHLP